MSDPDFDRVMDARLKRLQNTNADGSLRLDISRLLLKAIENEQPRQLQIVLHPRVYAAVRQHAVERNMTMVEAMADIIRHKLSADNPTTPDQQ